MKLIAPNGTSSSIEQIMKSYKITEQEAIDFIRSKHGKKGWFIEGEQIEMTKGNASHLLNIQIQALENQRLAQEAKEKELAEREMRLNALANTEAVAEESSFEPIGDIVEEKKKGRPAKTTAHE